MTSTSGPGISLMTEYLGLAYYAEVPVVVWDVQRVGPATGLPTRTAQGDITQIYFASHGDTQMVMLFPGSVNECFEFGWKAFDLAERLQTPVFVMSDLDFGMNQWMTKPFEYPTRPWTAAKSCGKKISRGLSIRTAPISSSRASGAATWTWTATAFPTAPCRATATRERRTSPAAPATPRMPRYSESPEVWERMLDRIKRKFETARTLVPAPEIETVKGAEIGLIFYGSTEPAVCEARHILAQKGIPTDSLRIKAIPFTPEVVEFISTPQAQLRDRAEPRRADAPAAVPGNPAERGQAHFPFAYRRPAADR